jgi:hypothetical protein
LRSFLAAAAIATATLGAAALVPTAAPAQSAVEAEMIGFHQLCDKGDRRACVRFGILIGQTSSATPTGGGAMPTGGGGRSRNRTFEAASRAASFVQRVADRLGAATPRVGPEQLQVRSEAVII